jgi:hypothetical protein
LKVSIFNTLAIGQGNAADCRFYAVIIRSNDVISAILTAVLGAIALAFMAGTKHIPNAIAPSAAGIVDYFLIALMRHEADFQS